MEFSRQKYWSGLPCPPPGDLTDPGVEPSSPALQAGSLPTEQPTYTHYNLCWTTGSCVVSIHTLVLFSPESITMNKASGGDGIPVELFQILKDGAAALNMPADLENSAVATGLEKVSFHSNPKERQCQSRQYMRVKYYMIESWERSKMQWIIV